MVRRRHSARQRRGQASQQPSAANWAGLVATAAAVILATANAPRAANAARLDSSTLLRRQFGADAPDCASLCIRVKITEAADPGLAVGCDYTQTGYVACLCASSDFTAAYEQCLLDNCVFPSSLATGRSLFSEFCSNADTPTEASIARSVASSAVASQASRYSATATDLTTSTTGSAASSSTTSGSSTSGSTTSGASQTTGTSTSATVPTASTGGTNSGSQSGSSNSNTGSQQSSSSTLNQGELASARANATGVSAAPTQYSVPAWSLGITAACALLGALTVFA